MSYFYLLAFTLTCRVFLLIFYCFQLTAGREVCIAAAQAAAAFTTANGLSKIAMNF